MKNNTNMPLPPNVVSLILNKTIRLEIISNDLVDSIKLLGAQESNLDDKIVWVITFQDNYELARKLQELNKLGVLFVGQPSGWPPAEIFADLREKNLLEGTFNEITWIGKGKWVIRER
jgi:hypothetical protein